MSRGKCTEKPPLFLAKKKMKVRGNKREYVTMIKMSKGNWSEKQNNNKLNPCQNEALT